eukprot:GHVL01045060.1.p1 GENE.GHVL01045060.1~~GHVL01045060.1.p1  ORF type:complete len:101 (+),score=13.49 GHVL01045060.1:149-451(+)
MTSFFASFFFKKQQPQKPKIEHHIILGNGNLIIREDEFWREYLISRAKERENDFLTSHDLLILGYPPMKTDPNRIRALTDGLCDEKFPEDDSWTMIEHLD